MWFQLCSVQRTTCVPQKYIDIILNTFKTKQESLLYKDIHLNFQQTTIRQDIAISKVQMSKQQLLVVKHVNISWGIKLSTGLGCNTITNIVVLHFDNLYQIELTQHELVGRYNQQQRIDGPVRCSPHCVHGLVYQSVRGIFWHSDSKQSQYQETWNTMRGIWI